MANIKRPPPGGKTPAVAAELERPTGAVICDALATLTALALQFDINALGAEIAENPLLTAEIIHSLTVGVAPTLSVEAIERAVRDVIGTGAPLLGFAPVAVVLERGAVLARHPAQPWEALKELRAELGSSLLALHRHLCSLPPAGARVLH